MEKIGVITPPHLLIETPHSNFLFLTQERKHDICKLFPFTGENLMKI